MSIEIIEYEGNILAVVAKTSEINDSLCFISPENFPLQAGIHNKKEGSFIEAHEHYPFDKLENLYSQEVFYVESGEMEIGLYYKDKKVKSIILREKDLMIANAGHDLKFLKDSKFIEIKQGPYRGKEIEKRFIKVN